MMISGGLYWSIVAFAAMLYMGANVFFLRMVVPHPAPGRGRLKIFAWHGLLQLVLLAALTLLLQMLGASLLLMAMALGVLLIANNKKFGLLKEPLMPADIAMTLRQWRSWRLLASYAIQDRRAMVFLPVAFVTCTAVLVCDPWILGRYNYWLAAASPVLLAVVFAPPRGRSLAIRLMAANKLPFCEWNVTTSMTGGGFFPTFIRCMDGMPRPAVRSISAAHAQAMLAEKSSAGEFPILSPPTSDRRPPNIVVVLAEAFMDPRAVGLRIEPDPLVNYDAAVEQSDYSGVARVPVYGGWTIRSEYSLLTGISLASFSNNIGNPNATLVSRATHSLPKHLQKLGYRTALVHPYDGRFYGRNVARASLGFDEFLDGNSFTNAPCEGRYVSDVAVAERVERELREAVRPTFLFCVTMENHGPWSTKTPAPTEPFTTEPPLSETSLTPFSHYLRHLRSADRMIGRLTEMVATADQPTLVLLVGDHMPSFTDMFREIKYPIFGTPGVPTPPGREPWLRTPYFLLSNFSSRHCRMDCDMSFLPGLVLDCAGLNGDRFFRENSAMRRRQNGNLFDPGVDPELRQAYLRYSYEVAAFPERYAA